MTTETEMVITVTTAQTTDDFDAIRCIRNAGREWMEDTREISPVEQEAFRHSRPAVWLYRADDILVGYGRVTRREDGHLYISLAVAPAFQGLGVGTHIYWDLRRVWTADHIYARCRATNVASIRAAVNAGYVHEPEMSDETWTVLRGDPR